MAKRCPGVNVELKTHNLVFRSFIFLCVQLFKNIAKCFLFIIIHIFSTHFGINLFYLHNLKTQTNYGTTTAPFMWMNEIKTKTKIMSHSNWGRVLLFDLAHKQYNGIIKGLLYWLKSESKGRFLVNNILLAWSLVMA